MLLKLRQNVNAKTTLTFHFTNDRRRNLQVNLRQNGWACPHVGGEDLCRGRGLALTPPPHKTQDKSKHRTGTVSHHEGAADTMPTHWQMWLAGEPIVVTDPGTGRVPIQAQTEASCNFRSCSFQEPEREKCQWRIATINYEITILFFLMKLNYTCVMGWLQLCKRIHSWNLIIFVFFSGRYINQVSAKIIEMQYICKTCTILHNIQIHPQLH